MTDRPNWDEWILQKNAEAKEEELKKGDSVIIEKTIREPDVSSVNTDPSINPKLGGKYGKIHGGDPRKSNKGPGSGDKILADEFIEGKKKRVSGASNLRRHPGVKTDENGNKLEKASSNGQWTLEKATHARKAGLKPLEVKAQLATRFGDPKAKFNVPKEHLPLEGESQEQHGIRVHKLIRQSSPNDSDEQRTTKVNRAWEH